MDIKKEFSDLAKKYNLTYQYQDFENCYGGHWWVYTHSLYNDTGCFTIHCLPQRDEVDCYYTAKFSNVREKLCGKLIDIYAVEKEIWEKNRKFWIFNKPFYYWSSDRVIKTIFEIIKVLIERDNEFFGIKINPSTN